MRTQGEHIRALRRRVDFLKARDYKNSYDAAELGALEWALVNLPAQQALDKKAENARELGLDYEPAQQEPIIKSYLKKDNSQPVKWSDYEPDGMHHNKRPQNCGTGYCSCIECVMEPAQRTWVGLTDEERDAMIGVTDLSGTYYYDDLYAVILAAEGKLAEKNT